MKKFKLGDVGIYWIDRYAGHYRAGASHGSIDGDKTLCNRDMNVGNWDGGYVNASDTKPDCKRCLKKLEKLKNEDS